MDFQVAGTDIHPLIPPLVAFLISLLTSTGGVSGAFLLLPFQMSVLGVTGPTVSATNHVFNAVGIPGGVWRYVQEGRMLWPLTVVYLIGTLPGVFIGAIVRVKYLPDPRDFKLFAGLVLLYIGARLVRDLLRRIRSGAGESAETRFQEHVRSSGGAALPKVEVEEFSWRRIAYAFYGDRFSIPVIPLAILSVAVGVVGGTYGIGGGSIMAPLYVAFFGLPVYTVAGATLLGTMITSIAGMAFFQILAPYFPDLAVAPDWTLGLMFGAGGIAGMYCGARLQKFVPARIIKLLLAGCVLFLSGKYILGF